MFLLLLFIVISELRDHFPIDDPLDLCVLAVSFGLCALLIYAIYAAWSVRKS